MSNKITVIGCCIACQNVFEYDPKYVPSIRPYNQGKKEAICQPCFNRWNQIHRVAKGLAPEPLHPSAYPERGEQ